MTDKEKEVADLMEQRVMDILSVQDTRWKEEKARCIVEDIKCGTVEAETKWCENHIEKGVCGEGSGIVEENRQDNKLKDGTQWCYVECYQCVCAAGGVHT